MNAKTYNLNRFVVHRASASKQTPRSSGPRLPWRTNHKAYGLSRLKHASLFYEDNATEVALGGLMDGSDEKLRGLVKEGLCEQAEELLTWELSQCADPYTRKKILQVTSVMNSC